MLSKSIAVAVLSLLLNVPAQAASPRSIVDSASSCMDWKITGVCPKKGLFGRTPIRVSHWVPVAYVEAVTTSSMTTVSGGQAASGLSASSIGGVAFGSGGGQSSSVNTNNSFDVNVLLVSHSLWMTSNTALSVGGRVCSPSVAYAPLAGHEEAVVRYQVQQAMANKATADMAQTAVGAGQCSAPNSSYFAGGASGLLDKGWSSSGDIVAWRTGCRDADAMQAIASGQVRCDSQGNSVGSVYTPSACVGTRGLLAPRQSREIGRRPQDAAIKTAYRGLHLGRTSGALPFPVDGATRMSQAYPSRGSCQAPGSPTSNLSVSSNGNYGWLVWRKVSCCI